MFRRYTSPASLASLALLFQAQLGLTAPTLPCIANSSCGPAPGASSSFSSYKGITAPWPGNTTGAVLNTTSGPPGPDDLLFQNLLSAEWIIFSFYQQGVERFNSTAFRAAGFPADTYDRIREIRNNEAGHLRIFQNQISSSSIKPGPCEYKYPFKTADEFLALQTILEVSSMAFLTGLALEAKTNLSKGALVAIASTETRHNTWAQMANWHVSPFAGPSDTYFPYANQILQITTQFAINGTCPTENPIYPNPRQNLLPLSFNQNRTTDISPGSKIQMQLNGGLDKASAFKKGQDYYAVFFHGVLNITQPFNTADLTTVIPAELDPEGILAVVIATEKGAPTVDSVVAGPMIILQDPADVGDFY